MNEEFQRREIKTRKFLFLFIYFNFLLPWNIHTNIAGHLRQHAIINDGRQRTDS